MTNTTVKPEEIIRMSGTEGRAKPVMISINDVGIFLWKGSLFIRALSLVLRSMIVSLRLETEESDNRR